MNRKLLICNLLFIITLIICMIVVNNAFSRVFNIIAIIINLCAVTLNFKRLKSNK